MPNFKDKIINLRNNYFLSQSESKPEVNKDKFFHFSRK